MSGRSDSLLVGSFSKQADQPSTDLAQELFGLLKQNKKWWLIPVVASLMGVGAMVLLSGTAAAPLIYTVF